MTTTSFRALLVAAAVALSLPLVASAATANQSASTLQVPAGKVIDGNYYAASPVIEIDGRIAGDLICAGQTVIIKGEVTGDVLCAAGSLVIAGPVGGSVRALARYINLENKIGRNLTVAAGSLTLVPEAGVGMDTAFAAGEVNHNGVIRGSVRGMATKVTLNGQVGADVNLLVGDGYCAGQSACQPLTVNNAAKIGGNLNYGSNYQAMVADPATIGGQVIHNGGWDSGSDWLERLWIWSRLLAIFGALIIGLGAMLLFKKQVVILADNMVDKPWLNIGWGFLVLLLLPLAAIFLAITIVGLPVALIITLCYTLAVMLAKPLAAITFGYVLAGRYRHKQGTKKKPAVTLGPIWTMVLGVVVTYAVLSIPVVGWLLSIIVVSWTIGAVWLSMAALGLKK